MNYLFKVSILIALLTVPILSATTENYVLIEDFENSLDDSNQQTYLGALFNSDEDSWSCPELY